MTLRTLNYGSYGIFLIMGSAGFCPSTVEPSKEPLEALLKEPLKDPVKDAFKGTPIDPLKDPFKGSIGVPLKGPFAGSPDFRGPGHRDHIAGGKGGPRKV